MSQSSDTSVNLTMEDLKTAINDPIFGLGSESTGYALGDVGEGGSGNLSWPEPAQPTAEVPKPVDPVEDAAEKFTNLLPYVSKIASGSGGKKSLVRVLHAFAEFPLGADKPRLLNEQERMLFSILQELQQYKSVILQSFMEKSLANQKTLQEKEKTNE